MKPPFTIHLNQFNTLPAEPMKWCLDRRPSLNSLLSSSQYRSYQKRTLANTAFARSLRNDQGVTSPGCRYDQRWDPAAILKKK